MIVGVVVVVVGHGENRGTSFNTVESSHSEVSEDETETEKSIKFHERNRTVTENGDYIVLLL